MFTSTLGYLLLILSLLAGIYVLYLNLAGIRKKRESLLAKAQLGMATIAFLVTAASLVLLFALFTVYNISVSFAHRYSSFLNFLKSPPAFLFDEAKVRLRHR